MIPAMAGNNRALFKVQSIETLTKVKIPVEINTLTRKDLDIFLDKYKLASGSDVKNKTDTITC